MTLGYRELADRKVTVHAKVCNAHGLPGLLKGDTCNAYVRVTCLPHSDDGLKDARTTKTIEGSLAPSFDEVFVL